MNLRDILGMAVGISVAQFCFSMEPCAAQEEIKLTKSITMLPDRPSGIQMIAKFRNEEHNQNDHFVLTLLTAAGRPAKGYLERVLALAAEKPVEFEIWEGADCSFVQTIVFRVRSKNGSRLVVGRAARTGEAIVNGEVVKSLADPSEQRIQIFVPKQGDMGRSTVWLDSVAETFTKEKLCEVEEVRQAIRTFVRAHMASLTSQQ